MYENINHRHFSFLAKILRKACVTFDDSRVKSYLDALLGGLQHLHEASHQRIQERLHRFGFEVFREHLQNVAGHAL